MVCFSLGTDVLELIANLPGPFDFNMQGCTQRAIRYAKYAGTSHIVVRMYKPNVPVIPLDQRMEMLLALSCVDIVCPYHELEYVTGCVDLNADVFVVGEDWGNKPHNIDVERYLEARNRKVVRLIYNTRTSSTSIKNDVMGQSRAPEMSRNRTVSASMLN